MHGLIFVAWEQFLERIYDRNTLEVYRKAIAGTDATTSRVNEVFFQKKDSLLKIEEVNL